jgi:imidazolonepropionase-like amidohydrolase
VLVEDGGGIVEVELMASEPLSDRELLEYGDPTVLPGLIDTLVHLVTVSGRDTC